MRPQSHTWDEVAGWYRDLVEQGLDMMPMLGLVEEIAASHYVHYAITSMFTLCLSQHPDFKDGRNILRVDFVDNQFWFNYRESHYSRNEWQKQCGRDQGYSTFEHVMRRLRWFMM